MKIAVFQNLPSGGAQRCLYERLKYLSSLHEIDLYSVATSSRNFLPLAKTVSREFVLKLEKPSNFISYLYFVFFKLHKLHKKWAAIIDKRGYDVVFVNHDFWTKAPYLIRFLKTPAVYLCHEYAREFYEPSSLHISSIKEKVANFFRKPLRKIDADNARSANLIVTGADYSRSLIEKAYRRKVLVAKNGVDLDFFRNTGVEKENLFLSVGAFSRLKNQKFIIEAISLSRWARKYSLLLIGNGGEEEEKLKALAKRTGVNLKIKKFVSDEELREFYNRAFLFLYAPFREPFGLVMLEAMACELPVVGVAEGGIKEAISKKVGWLIERNEKKFAKILDFLVTHGDKVEKLRTRARKYVEDNWSWDIGNKQFEQYLIKIANEHRNR